MSNLRRGDGLPRARLHEKVFEERFSMLRPHGIHGLGRVPGTGDSRSHIRGQHIYSVLEWLDEVSYAFQPPVDHRVVPV